MSDLETRLAAFARLRGADPAGARELLLARAPFSPHDPVLDALTLNIALVPTEGPPR